MQRRVFPRKAGRLAQHHGAQEQRAVRRVGRAAVGGVLACLFVRAVHQRVNLYEGTLESDPERRRRCVNPTAEPAFRRRAKVALVVDQRSIPPDVKSGRVAYAHGLADVAER
jgi:hypothetical protein